MTVPSFGSRYATALAERGRLCVGIDPHPGLLREWGYDDTPAGLARFALGAAEAMAPEAALVKPQSAFYERFGSRGIAVLEQVIQTCREAGALVLLDVKRGDIGSTSRAYADAYLTSGAPLEADAITVSPYLGFGSLTPFSEAAWEHGKGLFVLAATSNPEGPEVQQAVTGNGETVAARMLAHLREGNLGQVPVGPFGAVVGATVGPDTGLDFDFGGPILAPGYGAQGGTVDDLAAVFGPASGWVTAASSRGLLRKGPDPVRLRDGVRRANDELRVLGR